jgi:two-component sensor histidine kinase
MKIMDRIFESDSRIFVLLVTQIYNRATIGLIATAVNATILVYILWDLISVKVLVVWYILTLVSMILRFVQVKLFRRKSDHKKDIRFWALLMVIGIGISGLLWGSTAIFLFPVESTAHQASIAIVLAGMVAGAVGVFSPIMIVFLVFTIPALTPIFIRFIMIGDVLHLALSCMTLVFGILTFITAKHINSTIQKLILLRLNFSDQLEERTDELKRVNEKLREEIEERRQTEKALKKTEEQIKKSLEEKTVLLQEIHHRVKNNMQVIISLMNLQAETIKDEELKEHFRETKSRINAMALIHHILYNFDSISQIILHDYLTRLVDSLKKIYNTSGINITVETNSCRLNISQAIPCGLVINELISNALKYAFPENRSGEVRIEAFKDNSDHLIVKVSDNGIGLPADFDIYNTATLGLSLVSGLVEKQLEGSLNVDRSRGTSFRIAFLCKSSG